MKEICDVNENLEALVAEKTEHINNLLREEKELAQSKSQFLSNISHEFKTPINGIIGLCNLVDKTNDLSHLNEIKNLAKKINHLMDQILRINSYEKINNIENFSKMFFLKSFYSYLSMNNLKDDLLELRFNTDKEDFKIDMNNVYLIAEVLISNAIKFSGQKKVLINVNEKNDAFSIEVIDQGPGIDLNKIGSLLQPFTQSDNSDTRRIGGLGLGLSFAKKIADSIGAEIRFENLDIGAKFSIHCVAKRDNEVSSLIEPEKIHALIVDDDKINTIVLKSILDELNISTKICYNGKEAVEMAVADDSINLIFMDCQMPVMDGFEATQLIKEKNNRIKIIAVTANGLDENKEKVFNSGMDGFLVKPIDKHLIDKNIQNVFWWT